MKMRLITTLAIVLMLFATLSLPAVAAEEVGTVPASVTVLTSEIVNITISDSNSDGIQFGSVAPDDTKVYGDQNQDDVTPAVTVTVESDTNVQVDISIKGLTGGALTLDNWKYSKTFAEPPQSIPSDYAEVYTDVGSNDYAFYHWISVPVGTAAISYTATISYKAEKHT